MPVDEALLTRLVSPAGSGDVKSLLKAVEAETHHGRPGVNAETKRWLAGELRDQFADRPAEILIFAGEMASTDSVTMRSIASILLRDLWQFDRDTVMDYALMLAGDEHWEVREWAASLWGHYLDDNFDTAWPVLLELTSHPDVNIRRAMIVATMSALDRKKPQRAAPLIALVEPLLADRAAYIKKNLGPFAIGSGLLRVYPQPTLDALEEWSRREDEMTRWNVAMVGAAAGAARQHTRFLPVLEFLALDERRAVRLAVRSAFRTLNKRIPTACEPALTRLALNPGTVEIAEYALQ